MARLPARRWTAGDDGIAHAHAPRGRVTRTECGQRAIDERYAWPTVARCVDCIAVLEGMTLPK